MIIRFTLFWLIFISLLMMSVYFKPGLQYSTLLGGRSVGYSFEVYDEAGFGHLCDGASLQLGRRVRRHGEAGHGHTLRGGEQSGTVDRLVQTGEAWRPLSAAGYLTVTPNARVVACVSV